MLVTPYFKDIVLVGGGHAHVLLIRRWGMKAIPGVRLTLVSPDPQTPYSGMLPGLIAGHYTFSQTHIDLIKLCHWAGVRFIQDKVVGVNPVQKKLILNSRSEIYYDVLSLDVGSTPDHSVRGAVRNAMPIKPIAVFYQKWQSTLEKLRLSKTDHELAVVGGGAGALEVILAMAYVIKNDVAIEGNVKCKLIFRSSNVLPGYSKLMRAEAEKSCSNLGVSLQGDFCVSRVESAQVVSTQGQRESFDHLFWCAHAGAPSWLSQDGIACNEDGFVSVNKYLQSISHSTIFAVGDIAHMVQNPRPKAGVYAVRQAPFLYDNLRHYLYGEVMRAFCPQENFLSILAFGDKLACGSRRITFFKGTLKGAWVWRLKDRIDRKFMSKFETLPTMQQSESVINPVLIPDSELEEKRRPDLRCNGCGGKLGIGVLSQVLSELTGKYQPEDASIVDWPQTQLVQSIDQLSSPIDDPFLFGRIAIFHALSDLFAMNSEAHSIQLGLTLPYAGREIQTRELRHLLQGVLSACMEEKVILLGGHSAEGKELTIAVTVNGMLSEQTFSKQGLESGDFLALSKPIGSGILLAGQMLNKTQGQDLSALLTQMNTSNRQAAFVLQQLGVNCCTDVSGFGLLGHLSEMLAESTLGVELFIEKVPLYTGALELTKQGVASSLLPQNVLAVNKDPRWLNLKAHERWPLLLDPQTSGGLLAGIKPEQITAVEKAGFVVIGRVL